MIKKGLFKKPHNPLEKSGYISGKPEVLEELCLLCSSCKSTLFLRDIENNGYVCSKCGWHFSINARNRIKFIADEGTFIEHDKDMSSKNIIDFPLYDEKLEHVKKTSKETEEVICGTCKIGGFKTCIFAMNPEFMMGSMGVVIGEKITRLFEYATYHKLPVIGYTVSGGARMQEGIFSLMQMAKTSAAVKRHSDSGLLYVVILTNPTTGGVTASFAMEGDIILSEPDALIGFAGPRVIEQTIRQKLPKGFQRAEFVLETGFIDEIVHRKDQKDYLKKILDIHCGKGETL